MGVRELFPLQCDTGPLLSLSLLSAARDLQSFLRTYMPLLGSYRPCAVLPRETGANRKQSGKTLFKPFLTEVATHLDL